MLTLTLTLTAYLRERLTMHIRRNALHIKWFSFRNILSVNLTTRFLVIGIHSYRMPIVELYCNHVRYTALLFTFGIAFNARIL
jgi:hypothetical protein